MVLHSILCCHREVRLLVLVGFQNIKHLLEHRRFLTCQNVIVASHQEGLRRLIGLLLIDHLIQQANRNVSQCDTNEVVVFIIDRSTIGGNDRLRTEFILIRLAPMRFSLRMRNAVILFLRIVNLIGSPLHRNDGVLSSPHRIRHVKLVILRVIARGISNTTSPYHRVVLHHPLTQFKHPFLFVQTFAHHTRQVVNRHLYDTQLIADGKIGSAHLCLHHLHHCPLDEVLCRQKHHAHHHLKKYHCRDDDGQTGVRPHVVVQSLPPALVCCFHLVHMFMSTYSIAKVYN